MESDRRENVFEQEHKFIKSSGSGGCRSGLRNADRGFVCALSGCSRRYLFSRDAKSVLCAVTWKRWLDRCFYSCKHSIRSSSIQSSKDAAVQPWTRNTITSDIKRYHAEAVSLVNFKHSLKYISLVGETVLANGRALCLAATQAALHESNATNMPRISLMPQCHDRRSWWGTFFVFHLSDYFIYNTIQYNTIQYNKWLV